MDLEQLSNEELQFVDQISSLKLSMDGLQDFLIKNNTFGKYSLIYAEYVNQIENLESFKRALFIQWYSFVEPSCFSGINELDGEKEILVLKHLEQLITSQLNDFELNWMIKWYYRIGNYYFDRFKFLENSIKVLNSEFHHGIAFPVELISKMRNRGQMGLYFKSIGT